jgi:general L-amino acid transport system permease protein
MEKRRHPLRPGSEVNTLPANPAALQRHWSAPSPVESKLSWSNPRTRAIVWQIGVVAAICVIVVLIALQTVSNLKARSIASGFGYLNRATGFEISPGPLAYSSRNTYARALELGLINTLRVSVLAILISSALGVLIGIARLSSIWVVAAISRLYVEALRNTPLLLQLLFWYSLSQVLPEPRHALSPIPGVFLCLRGLYLPSLAWRGGQLWLVGILVALLIIAPPILARSQRRRDQTEDRLLTAPRVTGTLLALLSAAIIIVRPMVAIERPVLTGFDFHGGLSISPEFAALLIGLSTYTAAFIGEIVRGGILAVNNGQTEAAAALGLSRGQTLRRVILPQALPVIIPPATSQFLGLVKNSSLAVAIGYPDLISITSTTLNQTGQAIEAITIVMILYLAISLAISLGMNFYQWSLPSHTTAGRAL